jgi:hypothetical protein
MTKTFRSSAFNPFRHTRAYMGILPVFFASLVFVRVEH